MEAVFSWVKSGLIFAVFASVILMLCPSKTYMKHISLVVGLLFILVMLHPIMDFFQLDSATYLSYIEHFLMIEESEAGVTKEHMDLYVESIELQLLAEFNEQGYPVRDVDATADTEGTVEEVHISFSAEVVGIEYIDAYLKDLFGQEVLIYYEVG